MSKHSHPFPLGCLPLKSLFWTLGTVQSDIDNATYQFIFYIPIQFFFICKSLPFYTLSSNFVFSPYYTTFVSQKICGTSQVCEPKAIFANDVLVETVDLLHSHRGISWYLAWTIPLLVVWKNVECPKFVIPRPF